MGRIVETEAYLGGDDKASHSMLIQWSRNRQERGNVHEARDLLCIQYLWCPLLC